MEKIMQIEGMHCGNCSGRVKKALEAVSEVESADVSHADKKAVVTLKTTVADDVLKNAVEAEGFKVLAVQ